MKRAGAAAALLVVGACGKPAPPEPAVPEAVPVVDGIIDAAVAEAPAQFEDIIDVGLPPGPLQAGDPMPALPPPPCDDPAGRIDHVDVNGDGSPDVRRVFFPGGGSQWLACQLTDIDHDGDYDMATLFDRGGGRLVEYLDLDFDGQVDVASRYDPQTGAALSIAHDLDDDGAVDDVVTPGGAPAP